MNAVGIDVSKGKSMVAVMRPFGAVVATPYKVSHTDAALKTLAKFLKILPGETRIVMESPKSTINPLSEAGLFVSVVNTLLIYRHGNNSI